LRNNQIISNLVNLKTIKMAEDFFLKRKQTPSIEIDKYSDYSNTNIESDLQSCGLSDSSESTFGKRNELFFDELKDILDSAGKIENPVAIVSNSLEKHFSIREISFLLSKSILKNVLLDLKEQEKENNN
jgi:hypothetical protein